MRTAKGRVLRDTTHGDGLMSVEGNQYTFRLEGMWKSDIAPKVNMQVEVDFDDAGTVVAVRGIDPGAAAREQAAQMAAKASETTKKFAAELQAKGGPMMEKAMPVVQRYTALIGVPTLIALVVIFFGWFIFSTLVIEVFGRETVTFYQVMGLLNNPETGIEALGSGRRPGTGIYGLVTLLAFLAPVVPHFVSIRQLWFLYFAPIGWMALAYVIGRWKISSAISAGSDDFSGFPGVDAEEFAREMREMQEQMMDAIGEQISLGFGAWIAIAAGLYLGYLGYTRYRAAASANVAAVA
jgi:hypothetical protein